MIFAATYITVDPTWPWDFPVVGLPALAGLALVLIVLTVWTYLGVRKITRLRLLTILALRLAALIVACLLVLRPSVGHQDDQAIVPSKLLILVDSSSSMDNKDEFAGTRWSAACGIITSPAVKAALKELADENKIEAVYYQGAENIDPRFRPDSKPLGKRTDFGTWLHELWQRHGREGNLRGLLIFSDGADNGTRYVPLQLAQRWAGVCPLHTFALGNPGTLSNQRDIILTNMAAPLKPVPVKTKFSVTGRIDAWGFENNVVDVGVLIEEDPGSGKMKPLGHKERVFLKKSEGNEVTLTRDVPSKPGNYKVAIVVDPLPGEVSDENNRIDSYITASKDGVSILWVEGRKRLESTFILRYALARDKRFRLYPAEKLTDIGPSEADWYNFDQQYYDVIVIGDISAERFSSGQKDVFQKINALVKGGTGLMLFGGHEALGNSDWNTPLARELAALLPVDLNVKEQLKGKYRVLPTRAGLNHYLLKLDNDPLKNQRIWEHVFEPLDGMTKLGPIHTTATLLASSDGTDTGEPILAATQFGNGRVLVFGGDTTWKSWRRDKEMLPYYELFWRQTMLWLARQENTEGAAWIELDVPRLVVGVDHRLGFNVGLRGKAGEIKDAKFKAWVTGPGNEKTEVVIQAEDDGQRGYFVMPDKPGEYRVHLEAKGKDVNDTVNGQPREIKEETSARFLIVADDLEKRRPAADHEFLGKLARAGGGQFYLADETRLLKFLADLKGHDQNQARVKLWPDWRRNPPPPVPGQSSNLPEQVAAMWRSAALPCMILFAGFLTLEWVLRRRWELV